MSKIYIINYDSYWLKIVYSNNPFNLYEHYQFHMMPFDPELILTIHNATSELFTSLLDQLDSVYNVDLHIENYENDKYLFTTYAPNILNILYNFHEANKSFEQSCVGFVTINNKSHVKHVHCDNYPERDNVNTAHTTLHKFEQHEPIDTIEQIQNGKLPSDKLEYIKSINMALFIWLDKFVRFNINLYTIKKDAYNSYKAFAKTQMLPELKLQDFYSIINEIGFDDVRKDNNSVFDWMEIVTNNNVSN